jgi:hypothetical protein
MKEDSLRQHLSKLTIPEASESARSRAKHRALIAFQQGGSSATEPAEGKHFAWRRYAFTLVLLAVLVPLFIFWPHTVQENLADDRQILEQMEKLFPNQVDSVVVENGKINLSISQSSLVGSDQPILVVFRKDSQSIRVLSYSGHHVCISLGNQEHCFDILATPAGSVILEGTDKVWLVSEHSVVAGYSIQAQTLEASL